MAAHDHYTSTDLDPNCDMCMMVIAYRPLEIEEEDEKEEVQS